MHVSEKNPRWLLLIFSLPAKRASERVEIWRKLKRSGALPCGTSGHLLPFTPDNHERFEWLASSARRYQGQASVVQVHSIDGLSSGELRQRFMEARAQDYESLLAGLKTSARARPSPAQLVRLRRRFEEIKVIDFFDSPLRSRLEGLLSRASHPAPEPAVRAGRRKEFHHRTWVTRARPGIDRVSSAWLIRRFIDPAAEFVFAADPARKPGAIPFDMFQPGGFGHRGEDCTFETLRKEFRIKDAKVAALAEVIHDADLGDGKFGRSAGAGLDHVLIGWAQQGVADQELLRRGMELIEGFYHSIR